MSETTLQDAQGSTMSFRHKLILARDERTLAAHAASIPLPVRPEDLSRVDEKYRAYGPGSIDDLMGPQDERSMTP